MYLTRDIIPEDVEAGTVPAFLVEIRNEKSGCDITTCWNKSEFRKIVAGVLFFLGLAAFAFDFVIASPYSDYYQYYKWGGIITAASFVISALVVSLTRDSTGEEEFGKITRLFRILDITPEAHIGKMSKETFRGCVEAVLKAHGARLLLLNGFDLPKQKERFKGEVAFVADEFGLAHENYTKYI